MKESSLVETVFVAPGNAGMTDVAELISIEESNQDALVKFAQETVLVLLLLDQKFHYLRVLLTNSKKRD